MTKRMLTVNKLNTFYGRAHILRDVSLDISKGEAVALLGRNGAGKSTTMKSIMGLLKPASGLVEFEGKTISGLKSYHISRLGIGYVPEERRVFAGLSVLENFAVGKQKPRQGGMEQTPENLFKLFPNLESMKDRPASQMSGGEQQMLTIARTLMGNPKLLLLDEPSEGLAPLIVEEMARTILQLKSTGITLILSEQNLRFANLIADKAYIIEKGEIRYKGTMDDLNNNAEVRDAYLTL
ncbi:MAG: ABC transporter ATP-binding protein [SAR324 cluster bacterium]|nr:ABC transporter ATP-binding protein [SAR324 cluster bacterium]